MQARLQTSAILLLAAAAPTAEEADGPPPIQLRVSKGFGTKPYNTLRVSAITAAGENSPINATFSADFRYKWTHNALHSTMLAVQPGTKVPFAGTTLHLPAQGAGVSGVLIADPCVAGSVVPCTFAKRFQTESRTPALLNAFMRHDDTQYWAVLGDNWYDQHGHITAKVYEKLALSTLSKIMLTVPGNHDYWVLGNPLLSTVFDQYANGHMQFYAQDSRAAADLLPGDAGSPFDFSVDPGEGHHLLGGELPAVDNSFFYHQIGNVGYIGYSSAYDFETELYPRLLEACAWLPKQKGLQLAVLVGHWDKQGEGAQLETALPTVYDTVRHFDGCRELDEQRALKFVMGHTHCNEVHPHGHVDTGFMVAGQGMEGCGNYGIPVLDTTEDRVRIYYFEVVARNGTDRYDDVEACVRAKGWRSCTALAEIWLDQPLKSSTSRAEVAAVEAAAAATAE